MNLGCPRRSGACLCTITLTLLMGLNPRSGLSAEPAAVELEKNMSVVHYEKFGAIGDGVTDDIEAIVKAHEFANKHGLPVKADTGKCYYIGGQDKTAVIQTQTDWGTAKFIIDDTAVKNHRASIFLVSSSLKPFKPKGLTSLKKTNPKSMSLCLAPASSTLRIPVLSATFDTD